MVINAEWIFGQINLFISERDYKDVVDFFYSDSIQWLWTIFYYVYRFIYLKKKQTKKTIRDEFSGGEEDSCETVFFYILNLACFATRTFY